MHLRIVFVLAALGLLLSGPSARAQFGTVKGQIVYGEDTLPAPKEIDVNKDQAHCLSKGKILSEEWVIDKDSKGVKWVFVWLVDDKGNPLPPNSGLPACGKEGRDGPALLHVCAAVAGADQAGSGGPQQADRITSTGPATASGRTTAASSCRPAASTESRSSRRPSRPRC
jgi:hypothetical protein